MAFQRFQTLGLYLSFALVSSLLCFPGPVDSSAIKLQHFIGCAVREFTFVIQKPGCRGLRITTDACWGRCKTWEKPLLQPPFIESYQQICTYNQTKFVTVQLPNCSAGVDPVYTYPIALQCQCGVCMTRTTECITSI